MLKNLSRYFLLAFAALSINCSPGGEDKIAPDGSFRESSFPSPGEEGKSGRLRVRQIAAGGRHSCAVLEDGTVRCWGANDYGQLGTGSTEGHCTPTLISELRGVQEIALGENHSCALLETGDAFCWGNNEQGQLGDGTRTLSYTPEVVTGLSNIVQVSAGGRHTCAGIENSEISPVYCWGGNSRGQLGVGDQRLGSSELPLPLEYFRNNVLPPHQIALGRYHSCVLRGSSSLSCWGENSDRQLGNVSSQYDTSEPQSVRYLQDHDITQVALGEVHTCLLENGTVRCWGQHGYRGTIADLTNAVQIAVSGEHVEHHSCALLETGNVRCWGNNERGQLGDGTVVTRGTPTPPIQGLENVIQVTTGYIHTCALIENGTVRCWGGNYACQLGDGTKENRNRPVEVEGL